MFVQVGNSFSEVNLDISVLLSEVVGDVGDVYLEQWVWFGVIGSFFFFWVEGVMWELDGIAFRNYGGSYYRTLAFHRVKCS